MKRKLLLFFAGLLFLCGLGLLLYPTVRTAAFRQAEKSAIRQFEEYRAEGKNEARQTDDAPEDLSQPVTGSDETPDVEEPRAFPELWEACVRYNTLLPETQGSGLTAQSMTVPALNLSEYGWEQEVFACLFIPSADIETPLYLGADRSNLNRGGTILGQTSLPIGGESTHCVVGGHRTWNGILHPFVSLEQVQIGDLVYVTNPWETLTYRVIATDTISPNDMAQIRIQPGRDLLSVFTCTYPNTHRYLITCERVLDGDDHHWKNHLLPWVLTAYSFSGLL